MANRKSCGRKVVLQAVRNLSHNEQVLCGCAQQMFSANKSQTICVLNFPSDSQISLYNLPLMKRTSRMIALASSNDTIDIHTACRIKLPKRSFSTYSWPLLKCLNHLNVLAWLKVWFPTAFSTSNRFLFQSDKFYVPLQYRTFLLQCCYFYNVRTTKTV